MENTPQNFESFEKWLNKLSKHELSMVAELVNSMLIESLGPEKDEQIKAIWKRDGRLMAIKSFHHDPRREKPKSLKDSIAYVDKLCMGLPQGEIYKQVADDEGH
jgi:hypothetical protein